MGPGWEGPPGRPPRARPAVPSGAPGRGPAAGLGRVPGAPPPWGAPAQQQPWSSPGPYAQPWGYGHIDSTGWPAGGSYPIGAPPAPPNPKKPIYARWWFITGAFLVVLLILAGALSGQDPTTTTSGGDQAADASRASASPPAPLTSPAPPSAQSPPAAAPTPEAAADTGKPADKDWVLESYKVQNSFGSFSGTARVTNTASSSRSMIMKLTLFRDGEQIASLTGAANDVAPGKTVTVDLLSSDSYSDGDFTVDFQVDATF